MKILFAAFVCVLCIVPCALAHQPVQIDIVYDSSGNILAAAVTHPVDDPEHHYIDKIVVTLNAKEIITHEVSRQDNGNTLTVTYRIPDAKAGDSITVDAYCNKSGHLKKAVEVTP